MFLINPALRSRITPDGAMILNISADEVISLNATGAMFGNDLEKARRLRRSRRASRLKVVRIQLSLQMMFKNLSREWQSRGSSLSNVEYGIHRVIVDRLETGQRVTGAVTMPVIREVLKDSKEVAAKTIIISQIDIGLGQNEPEIQVLNEILGFFS